MAIQDNPIQHKTLYDNMRQYKIRQDKTSQGNTRQYRTIWDQIRLDKTRSDNAM